MLTVIPVTEIEVQRVVVTFIDDNSFYTNSNKIEEKIHEILSLYTKLYKDTGSKVE